MGAQTAVEPGEPPRLPMLSFGNDKGFSLRCLPGGGEDFADVRSVVMRPGGQEAMQPSSQAAMHNEMQPVGCSYGSRQNLGMV